MSSSELLSSAPALVFAAGCVAGAAASFVGAAGYQLARRWCCADGGGAVVVVRRPAAPPGAESADSPVAPKTPPPALSPMVTLRAGNLECDMCAFEEARGSLLAAVGRPQRRPPPLVPAAEAALAVEAAREARRHQGRVAAARRK